MKVLQINSVCGVGSTGRIAANLYKILENVNKFFEKKYEGLQ